MPPSAWAARMRSAPLPSRRIRSTSSSAASAPTSRAYGRASSSAARDARARAAARRRARSSRRARRGRRGRTTRRAPRAASGASPSRLGARGQHEPVDERGEAADRAEPRLGVHRPHLERAELRVRADVPPQERVVLDVGGRDDASIVVRVVLPAGEGARDVGARVAAEQLRAGGLRSRSRCRASTASGRRAPAAPAGARACGCRRGSPSRGRACRRGCAARRSACAAAGRASGAPISRVALVGDVRRRRRTRRGVDAGAERACRPRRARAPRSASSERAPSIASALIGEARLDERLVDVVHHRAGRGSTRGTSRLDACASRGSPGRRAAAPPPCRGRRAPRGRRRAPSGRGS